MRARTLHPRSAALRCGRSAHALRARFAGSQPAWSAFREGSFGVGRLDVANATHAHFSWARSACEAKDAPGHITFNSTCDSGGAGGFANVTSDAVWLVRSADRASCGRQRSRDA